jgi:hypothetical protein
MKNLFKAEVLRFRNWALVAATAHVLALGFLSRLVDMAQQPLQIYQITSVLFFVAGALLGLYQMGTYRRPNHWINLLHRPLHRLQVAAALFGAGALVLLVAIALPIAIIATYQETLTARVVDLRHWLLPVAGLLIGLCGYLAGAYAMLPGRRHAWAVFLLPNLLLYAQASGPAMLAVQTVVLLILAGLVAIAFKPDLGAPPRGLVATAAVALPVLLGGYFLFWLLGYGYEVALTVAGTHPLERPVPPAGGFIEANRAEPKARLLNGIAGSRDPQAALWREQIALSEVFELYPYRSLPQRNELTNIAPMEFDDETHHVRWVFSHDRMRFVGYGTLDGRARGELGLGQAQAAFPDPVLPYADNLSFSATGAYQYDPEQQRIFQRVQLPRGEVFASMPTIAGDNLAVLGNRALYFYPGREAANSLDPLKPQLRVPLPAPVGNLMSVELIETLDGYLISFTYTWGAWSGESEPFQQVVRVDGHGQVHEVTRRALANDLSDAYTMRNWWLSPALRMVCLEAPRLFAVPPPLSESAIPAPPRAVTVLAGVLCLLSLLAAIWLSGRQAHSRIARWSWVLACGLIGLPALIALWLLYPLRERTESVPLAQPALA